MLDINLIRTDPDGVKAALKKKEYDVDFGELLSWDEQARRTLTEIESLRSRRNKVSAEIPTLKKNGQDVAPLMAEMKEVGEKIKAGEERHTLLEQQITEFVASLPNTPAEDVVAGGKENNVVARTFGEKPTFSFKPRDHVELATSLKLIDYDRGAKLGGAGFWVYTGDGAALEWALLNYFIEEHRRSDFEFILPPHILNYPAGFAAGQFPKFVDDVFQVRTGRETGERESMHFLLPTAETALINLFRDEILDEDHLPKKFFSYTPCYRREGGGYGATERGMVRGHQFNKVELFAYCRPSDSERLLEELIACAEKLLQGLGLHYQLSKLAAADCSPAMGKTFDLEVWIPSMGIYKEVSSASNAYDYQARRGRIRFKDRAQGKNHLVHTLNASGLATSRLFPAILEQFQQSDGSVVVPPVLRHWVGKDVLIPRG